MHYTRDYSGFPSRMTRNHQVFQDIEEFLGKKRKRDIEREMESYLGKNPTLQQIRALITMLGVLVGISGVPARVWVVSCIRTNRCF